MNEADTSRFDQLKTDNDRRTEDLQRMGFQADPSKEVTLRLASMLEVICERLEIRAEANLRFEEIRAEELDILIPAAVAAIKRAQEMQEEARHAEAAQRLGVRR